MIEYLKKNKIVSSEDILSAYNDVKSASSSLHSDIFDIFMSLDTIYSESTTIEDIATSLYSNTVKDLNAVTTYDETTYVIEDFSTSHYVDTKFPVDIKLNVDTDNKDLILPSVDITDLNIASIVINNDSNGTPGDSINNGINADLSLIVDSDPTSLFEYEKITSASNSDQLKLSLTLTTEKEDIVNALYIKLSNLEGEIFPSIDKIIVSQDGLSWTEITNFNTVNNKSDYFIRFKPLLARYVKITFIQNSGTIVQTSFGNRYRYTIAIREITIKKIKYSKSGTYISIPFSNKKNISSVFLSANDNDSLNIAYSLSWDNGSRWFSIGNNSILSLEPKDTGAYELNDTSQIRLKIDFSKLHSTMNLKNTSEYFNITSSNIITLSNTPIKCTPFIGGYISFGNKNAFTYITDNDNTTVVNIPFLQKSVLYNTNAPTLEGDVSVPKQEVTSNSTYSEIFIAMTDVFTDNQVKALSAEQLQAILAAKTQGISIEGIKSISTTDTNKPIESLSVQDLTLEQLAVLTKTQIQALTTDQIKNLTIEEITYLATTAVNTINDNKINTSAIAKYGGLFNSKYFTVLVDNKSVTNWVLEEDSRDGSVNVVFFQPLNSRAQVVIYLNSIVVPASTSNKISLPLASFYETSDYIEVFQLQGVTTKSKLDYNDVTFTKGINGSNDIITISDTKFNPSYKYVVSYIPSIELPIKPNIKDTSISISLTGLDQQVMNSSQLKIEYTYSSTENTNILDYYSPICNQVSLEFN